MNATLHQGAGQDPSCPPEPTTGFAVVDGVRFLRRQQACLLHRLRDAGDGAEPEPLPPAAVHAEWLELVAATRDLRGPDAAYRVARLYEYHGRVAGSLERQRQLPLPASVVQKLRLLLASHLSEMTDDAVAALSLRR